ncbi:arginine methyltransferase [Niveomyces insectorum RCEF 264]|uniref:type I protein arginine methyltransferase n=1 Tax=Niveomyces insectorum RCEF 264 TaxID=1081102 RepID=A0A167SJ70_9HYPO|nr:arginine methyltransferase [Niveomyces insectorum RCEF 264]
MSERDSQSNSSESSDEEGWLDENPEDDEMPQSIVSLLDYRVFSDAAAMLAHCKEAHGFDFLAIRDRLGLDFYGSVKLINFIRQRVRDGLPVSNEISAADIEPDTYLKPVLDDDALILCLDNLPSPQTQGRQPSAADVAGIAGEAAKAAPDGDVRRTNEALQAQLDSVTRQFENYRLAVQQTLDQRWGADDEQTKDGKDGKDAKAGKAATSLPKQDEQDAADGTDYYFQSYSHSDIHETMLKDAVRTDAYRDFIYGNKHLFAGKTVLDIGCGTGILSMFCAKAGAKLVIAVDRSEIINKARENVFHNGLANQITCLKGLIEDVTLPVDQVDIIVSEWMGYALLYEAMLPSVLYARDKYLKPDGLLVPSHAALWLAPVCDPEYVFDSIAYWRDVYGFDMQAMQAGIYDDVRVLTLPPKAVAGTPALFRMLDLHTVHVADLVFRADWATTLAADAESLDGFLVWFDIYFGASRAAAIEPRDATAQAWVAGGPDRVAFTTGPFGHETHWKQCLLLSKTHSKTLAATDSRAVAGEIAFITAPDNPRALTLEVKWTRDGTPEQKEAWALR